MTDMSLRRHCMTGHFCSSAQKTRSANNDEAISKQVSSSSVSSADDVDVRTAWDNYDLLIPLLRRCSDDRCSLLTQWTDSTTSLKSCVSHGAASRSLVDCVSTGTESDGGGTRRGRTNARRRLPQHHDRSGDARLNSSSNSRRVPVSAKSQNDSDLSSSRSNHSGNRELARAEVQRCSDGAMRRRPGSKLCQDTGRRFLKCNAASGAGGRHITVITQWTKDIDNDHVTASSEGEEEPSSTSSFVPRNSGDDRTSLLYSSRSTSSCSAFAVETSSQRHHLTDLPLQAFVATPKKQISGFRSPTAAKYVDDDDVQRSGSLDEVRSRGSHVVAALHPTAGAQSRDDELRAVRSLFEFRSNDELRIANQFVDGMRNVYSRWSLYNERQIGSTTASSTSPLFHFRSSRSTEKDFQYEVGSNAIAVAANRDRQSQFSDVTGSATSVQHDISNVQNDVDDIGNVTRRLNIAVCCNGAEAADEVWNEVRKDLCSLEMIAKVTEVTATVDDSITLDIHNSPMTFNDRQTSDDDVQDAGDHGGHLTTLVGDKLPGGIRVSDVLSGRLRDADHAGGKPPLSSQLQSNWLADALCVKTMTEGVDGYSRFASEFVQAFNALLVRFGDGKAASLADIKVSNPLAAASNYYTDCQCRWPMSNTPHIDKLCMGLLTEDNLLMKPELPCDYTTTQVMEQLLLPVSAEMSSSATKQPASTNDNLSTNNSTSNELIHEGTLPTAEDRKRLSRKSKGRGKVKELIQLFESTISSTSEDAMQAMISAASSVGEMLRHVNEQEVTSCNPPKIDDEQLKSTDAAAAAAANDDNDVTVASRVCQKVHSSAVEPAEVVYNSTVGWPATSQGRRRRAGRRVSTASIDVSATTCIEQDQLSQTGNRSSDVTAPSGDGAQLLHDEKNIRKTSKTVLSSRGATTTELISETDSGCPETNAKCPETNSGYRETLSGCCETTEGSNKASVVDSSLTTALPETHSLAHGYHFPVMAQTSKFSSLHGGSDSQQATKSSLPAAQPETGCQTSSPSHRPWKSLRYREIPILKNTSNLPNGGVGDKEDCSEQDNLISGDTKKHTVVSFSDELHTSPKRSWRFLTHTDYERICRETSTLRNAEPITANESTKTIPPETHDGYKQFTAQSWFVAGGPRLVSVQLRSASTEDVVPITDESRSKMRRPAKAILKTEKSCPAGYPVLRISGITVHRHMEMDNNSRDDNVQPYNAGGCGTPSIKKKYRSESVVSHKSKRTGVRMTERDKNQNKECVVGRQLEDEPVDDAMTKYKTTDLTSSSLDAANCGRLRAMNQADRQRRRSRQCDSVNRVDKSVAAGLGLPKSRQGNNDAGRDSDLHRFRNVKRRDCQLPSKSSELEPRSTRKQSESTSISRTSSVMEKFGLVPGKSVLSSDGVTVVHTRRRPCGKCDEVRDRGLAGLPRENYKQLAQQFLLASLLEYRLDTQRKSKPTSQH